MNTPLSAAILLFAMLTINAQQPQGVSPAPTTKTSAIDVTKPAPVQQTQQQQSLQDYYLQQKISRQSPQSASASDKQKYAGLYQFQKTPKKSTIHNKSHGAKKNQAQGSTCQLKKKNQPEQNTYNAIKRPQQTLSKVQSWAQMRRVKRRTAKSKKGVMRGGKKRKERRKKRKQEDEQDSAKDIEVADDEVAKQDEQQTKK